MNLPLEITQIRGSVFQVQVLWTYSFTVTTDWLSSVHVTQLAEACRNKTQ